METEIRNVFSKVLSHTSRKLYHRQPTFRSPLIDLIRYFNGFNQSRIPSITIGRNEYTHVYYINNVHIIYHILGAKICSQMNKQLLDAFIRVAKDAQNKEFELIINDLISSVFIATARKNYETTSAKVRWQDLLLCRNGTARIRASHNSQLELDNEPVFPPVMWIISQLIIGIDLKWNDLLFQFEMVRVVWNFVLHLFVVSPGINLMDNNYTGVDLEFKRHNGLTAWNEDDSLKMTRWNRTYVASPGLFTIKYEYNGVALKTIKRWTERVKKEYLTNRKKLRLALNFREWMNLLWDYYVLFCNAFLI